MLGSIIGGLASAAASLFGAKSEADTQKQFAQKGIQWKVEDAKKAGIHPLFALGANTVSYQPSNVGSSLGSALSEMGAGIDRSRAAASEAGPRGAVGALALERAGLENDLLRAQIASEIRRSSPPAVGPAMPSVHTPAGDWVVSPFTPAQDLENQYGELAGDAGGLMNLDRDLPMSTLFKYSVAPWARKGKYVPLDRSKIWKGR